MNPGHLDQHAVFFPFIYLFFSHLNTNFTAFSMTLRLNKTNSLDSVAENIPDYILPLFPSRDGHHGPFNCNSFDTNSQLGLDFE